MLLDIEIRGLVEELASSSSYNEILDRKGTFSIAKSKKYKAQYELEWLARLL
jgi:hypothetical protein